MSSLIARWFFCRIVTMTLPALLLAAGCTTAAPTPALTPDPTVPGMEPRAPATTVVPKRITPTALSPASTPTTAPSSTELQRPLRVAGPASPDDGESELLEAMESLPLEFAERGIWFTNPKQSLEASGVPRPRSLEEFEALSEDQRQKYVRNSGGGVSSLLITVKQTTPHWKGAYGFSIFEVDAITATGMYNYMPLETNYITGEFDEEAIVQRLTELGYRTEPAGGQGEPGEAVRGHPGPVRGGGGS